MIGATDLARLQPLIADAGVDGWLLFDFRGRNPIAAAVLGPEIVGSRRVYVLIPPSGVPVALVHAVDAELWREWPATWTKRVWVTREELSKQLGALVRGKRVAVDWSPGGAIPYLDGVPLGVAEFLRDLGGTLVPSAELVTRYCSVWSPADRASHRRAAEAIAAIAREALALAGSRARSGDPISEHGLRGSGPWFARRATRRSSSSGRGSGAASRCGAPRRTPPPAR
jgi:Xaa-Pro dipeptidase